jgi:F-type H+-transporting ATPase subunit delta
MQGASRESLVAAQERLDTLLSSPAAEVGELAERATQWVGRFLPTLAATVQTVLPVAGPLGIGDELFAVVDLLDGQPSLRASLTDPSRSGDDKARLIESLLSGKVTAPVVDFVSGTVRARWSSPRDLVDALDRLGVEAVLVSAQRHERLDAVEDDVFRFSRIVEAEPTLRAALTDRALPAERKVDLLAELLEGKTTVEAARLLVHAVVESRGLSLESGLAAVADAAAARRQRLVATVTAAVPLTEQQRDRLAAALAAQFGHSVHLNVVVDPEVVGGLRVSLGDEVIDGTISTRLDEAARRLAG